METAENIIPDDFYGKVLRTGWDIFKSRFLILFSLSVTILIPLQVASYFLYKTKLFEAPDSFILKFLIWYGETALNEIAFLPVMMAFTVVVEGAFNDNGIGYLGAVKSGFAYWPRAAVVELLAGFVILGGLLALVLPGIYFYVALLFTMQAVILRDKRGWDALYYSKSLVDGRWVEIFVFGLILSLLIFIPLIIPVVLVIFLKPSEFMRAAVFYPISAITTPFFLTVITVLFLKLEQVGAPQEIQERKRHSLEGIASIAIFMLAMAIAGIGIVSHRVGQDSQFSSLFVLSCCTGIALPFVGLLFGLVGVSQTDARRESAVLGLLLNGAFCAFFIVLVIAGIIRGLFER
ncbi:MAG: hypothetical protein C4520_10820 [Candidatus Abyssobacteria bacterium SURF_5]|uniref:Uncharacterized protein n=1 Tax=Abyssobacteria bacterium (strain SURF_5) TaxID=2093360 RepID=A0A3A4NQS5_ABYX5|nr:MAG: hypothetical protein C4520_10820 [Candidatus Abyssubacteria bacterium SURF_5]